MVSFTSVMFSIGSTVIRPSTEDLDQAPVIGFRLPEPLLQFNPSFEMFGSLDDLAKAGEIHPGIRDIFKGYSLYRHQVEAIRLGTSGKDFIVTSGTGSGKSLTYIGTIFHHLLSNPGCKGVTAIVVYPMNALANSQVEELGKFVGNVPGSPPVRFARYTGQDDNDERRRIADNPPDILLTNFMMLELLMTRQDDIDRKVIGNCAGLRFLVLDELHTYRGRQGADVALLVRRVRERLSPDRLLCIGTSATMKSEGTVEDKNRVVSKVASKLFSVEIPESSVVGETLERVTDPAATLETIRPALGPAIDAGIPDTISDADLRAHPLAVWVENRLGLEWRDQRWARARPRCAAA